MKKYNTSPAARNREAALLELQQLSFSLVDLNLYLDTHPDCQQGISDYNQLFEQYWEAKASFEMLYGPLNNFGHCAASYPGRWINAPWPWERGGAV